MAKVKICLDAGHAGKYNRSCAVSTYYESDMAWKLHLKLKAELEKYGIEVITTRANQKTDKELTARGKAAKGCNLFLSLHSNAVGSTVNEGVDYPLVIVPVNGSGTELGKKLATCIEKTMGTKQKAQVWDKKNDNGADWYGVIRGAASVGVPGLILEHSFHTQTKAAKWLSNDSNLDKLAQAEAAVIAEYYGLSKTVTKTTYRLKIVDQVYNNESEAKKVLAKLTALGLTAIVKKETVEVAVAPAKPTPAPTPAKPVTPAKKTIEQIAQEVLEGKWGNGQDRKTRLTEAGYDYNEVQKIVNKLANGETAAPAPAKKSIDKIAQEVINGDWGNGQERVDKLKAAGYDPSAVQKKVNELLK